MYSSRCCSFAFTRRSEWSALAQQWHLATRSMIVQRGQEQTTSHTHTHKLVDVLCWTTLDNEAVAYFMALHKICFGAQATQAMVCAISFFLLHRNANANRARRRGRCSKIEWDMLVWRCQTDRQRKSDSLVAQHGKCLLAAVNYA